MNILKIFPFLLQATDKLSLCFMNCLEKIQWSAIWLSFSLWPALCAGTEMRLQKMGGLRLFCFHASEGNGSKQNVRIQASFWLQPNMWLPRLTCGVLAAK